MRDCLQESFDVHPFGFCNRLGLPCAIAVMIKIAKKFFILAVIVLAA
jgi:hypothetical protein